MIKNNNILVISAHPDDEVLGCGGSMAKWSDDGCEINVIILAEGLTSRDTTRNRSRHKNELSELAIKAQASADILGVKSVKLHNLPDNRLDSLDLLDIVKIIESEIKFFEPEVIVTHHLGDLNVDHQLVHKATITASRPFPGNQIKKIISFEVPSATEWQSISDSNYFTPNYFEDISKTLERKVQALNVYKSEMRDAPHARSINAVESLAKWRGHSVGLNAAEAFILLREIS